MLNQKVKMLFERRKRRRKKNRR